VKEAQLTKVIVLGNDDEAVALSKAPDRGVGLCVETDRVDVLASGKRAFDALK